LLHLLSLSVLLKFQINYQLFLLSGKLSGILSGFVTFPDLLENLEENVLLTTRN
jgi:hypothetical protein